MDADTYQMALLTLSDEELAAEHRHVWNCLSQHWDAMADYTYAGPPSDAPQALPEPSYVLYEMAEAAIPQYCARLHAIFQETLYRKQVRAQAPPSEALGAWTGRIGQERDAAGLPSPVTARR
jgi:hypothetical protein